MMFSGVGRLVARLVGRSVAVLGCLVMVGSLVACGGGTVHDPFKPSRFISFGDALSDITTSARYTVNINPANSSEVLTLVEQVAASYSFTTTQIISSAKGNARVATVDTFATGAPSLSVQVSTYLAGTSVLATDMFMMSAGIADLIEQYQTYVAAGSTTTALSAMNTAVDTAAINYASVVQQLVSAGAKRIIVVPPYDLSVTPWAINGGVADRASVLKTLTRRFNDKLLTRMSDVGLDGRVVVYAPIEFEMNRIAIASSNILGLSYITTPICDTPANDAGNGIGIGTGQLNSSKCTDSTLISVTDSTGTTSVTATVSAFAFADKIYPTPIVLRDLGTAIYNNAAAR